MPAPALADLRRDPNALAGHYRRFRVGERLLLSGHSHQAWPDVAREGAIEAFDDAALAIDEKWGRAEVKAERVREGFRTLLDDPRGQIALAASTHELLVRWLSALPLAAKPRLVTTDGEFHTLRRQLARLAEPSGLSAKGLEIARLPARPVETLAERLAAAIDPRTAAVLTSAVFFETARIMPRLDELAAACRRSATPLLVDAYHALGVVPFSLRELGLESALVTGGGYKYLQLGEGNCFLRLPAGLDLRPVVTGWFADFGGATYDPTSHYRAARVFDFFVGRGLTPAFLREVSQHQVGMLARLFDELSLPDTLVRRDRSIPLESLGGFLSLESPRAQEISERLLAKGVTSDARARFLRLGPAPYLSDSQLVRAMEILGTVAKELA
jgi:kynureninase